MHVASDKHHFLFSFVCFYLVDFAYVFMRSWLDLLFPKNFSLAQDLRFCVSVASFARLCHFSQLILLPYFAEIPLGRQGDDSRRAHVKEAQSLEVPRLRNSLRQFLLSNLRRKEMLYRFYVFFKFEFSALKLGHA